MSGDVSRNSPIGPDQEYTRRRFAGGEGEQGTAGGAPVAAVGVITANGKGRVTRGVRTINLGGTTVRQTFTCTYAVNPDGTGSATCPVSAPPRPTTETFDFVLEDGGRRFELLGTTAGTTVLGSGTRQ